MSAASPREESYQQWVDSLLDRISVLEQSRCEACLANEAWLTTQLASEDDHLSFEEIDNV